MSLWWPRETWTLNWNLCMAFFLLVVYCQLGFSKMDGLSAALNIESRDFKWHKTPTNVLKRNSSAAQTHAVGREISGLSTVCTCSHLITSDGHLQRKSALTLLSTHWHLFMCLHPLLNRQLVEDHTWSHSSLCSDRSTIFFPGAKFSHKENKDAGLESLQVPAGGFRSCVSFVGQASGKAQAIFLTLWGCIERNGSSGCWYLK